MTIPSAKYLKNKARARLASGQQPQEVVLVYAGISAAMALVVTLIRYFLSTQIAKTGGLGNIGIRSMLSTADNVLPILQSVAMMVVTLGYEAAMLRIARHQFASPKTLKAGAERVWPLLISRMLQGLIYAGVGFLVAYLAMGVFMVSPFSNTLMEQIAPLAAQGMTPESLLADEALMGILLDSMTPLLIIYAVLYIPILGTVAYRYRLVDFLLIDQPGIGAVGAMRQSRILMFRNRFRLFKVDLSFWWYYLLQALAGLLLYLDLILAMFGIRIPGEGFLPLLVLSVLYLGATFALNYFFLNHVTVTQALAYNSLVPKKEETEGGAVLGNIFQM